MSGNSLNLAYYRAKAADVLADLQSSKNGLNDDQVAKKMEEFGPNRLVSVKKDSLLKRYFRQFKDLMILLLVFCAVIAFATNDPNTGVVIIALIVFNTVIGFSQEYKAERLMDSLERLVVSSAKVRRDGQSLEVAATELVPGDIVYIEAGDSIPADLRLFEETELSTNDFALTGESNPTRKFTHPIEADVELANRQNLVFMGTTVALGQAWGVVIATGMNTELGRIANLSTDTPTTFSPLQKEMNNIATRVTQGTIVLCSVLLPVAMRWGNLGFKEALLFAIGFASSIIPQGLPAEINTALAQAANKLAKARALVKKLSAVETLGSTSVICTDKTGTLTKNQMTVEQFLVGNQIYKVTGSGYEFKANQISLSNRPLIPAQNKDLELFLATGGLASNAQIGQPDEDHATWYCIGDPTEGALITLAAKGGLDPKILDNDHPELREFPFDSARKRMTSIRKWGNHNQLYVFMKGAPESVLQKSQDIWELGHVRPLSTDDRNNILNQNDKWANQAMRNLGYAYKVLPDGTDLKKLKIADVEKEMIWLGMVSMIDPVREDVFTAMTAAHLANIKISIITGDFAATARAIATKAGLTLPKQEAVVISGEELRKLDDSKVLQLVSRGGIIFSRVSPEDKLRIVELVKKSGHVVAVTGDGINDAPALKRADIGVAMGKTGTDVAKQSAEIILLDDSFNTLIRAIQQGRVIFQNIKKGTLSCFTSNAAELVVSLVSLAAIISFNVPLALTVMQILAIDLIAELFPIAALGWDQADSDVMSERPRNPKEHILNRHSILDLAWCGLLIGGLAFLNYILFYWRNGVPASIVEAGSILHAKATTMTYITIVLCQFANILQRRSSAGLFSRYQLHNKQLWIALSVSFFLVVSLIYSPILNNYFRTGSIGLLDWIYALGAMLVFILVREIQRHANSHHSREHVLALLEQQ